MGRKPKLTEAQQDEARSGSAPILTGYYARQPAAAGVRARHMSRNKSRARRVVMVKLSRVA